ncbi:MAG: DUF2851 family protein [Bacteroidales bacterium]|nr:DUF2851 family protein [Bacteroidales bacterium]
MKEDFLHYIWKYKLYREDKLLTQDNESIEIINSGVHNFDSGPDFFNAKVKIGETVWAGNIEIHVKSSDWNLHKHNKDKAYDNVILQVVFNHDKDITRTNGQVIPTVEIKFNNDLLNNYQSLLEKNSWIACENDLPLVDPFIVMSWMEKLTVERLEQKSTRISESLIALSNSWETAFYIQLARNFGFKLNSDPFEMLAKSLSLNILAKHKDNLFQIEALLFGQAGFLEEETGDEYYKNLRKEYNYLQKKFQLKPIEKHLWKFLRSRPGNFPTIRIAQFASLIYNSRSLFSKIIEINNLDEFYTLFKVKPSEYWDEHYQFNKDSVVKSKALGKSAIDVVLINSIVPFLFVFGKSKGNYMYQERALNLLESIKPEKNSIINSWNDLNIKSKSAFDTQALIQLKNKYCNQKKCLNCQIGNAIINRK